MRPEPSWSTAAAASARERIGAVAQYLGRGKLSAQHRAADFGDFRDETDEQTEPGLDIHVICGNPAVRKARVVHRWLLAHPGSSCTSRRSP